MLEGEAPLGGLWPLLVTWTLAAGLLEESAAESWRAAAEQLGLVGTPLQDRYSALDAYLDGIEATLDELAAANGLETSDSLL